MAQSRYRRSHHFTIPDFPIALVPISVQGPVQTHAHEFTELVVILEGRGMHTAEGEEYPVCAGDCFVVLPGRAHAYRETHGLRLMNILYYPNELGISLQDLRALPGYHALFTLEPHYRKQHRFESRLRLEREALARVSAWIDELEGEISLQPSGFRVVATALLVRIIAYLSRCYTGEQTSAALPLLRIGEAISYLEENYDQPITLEELCRVAHMSESSLLRAFRQALDVTPIDYLIRLRLDRAAALLRRTRQPVTEIALTAGFSDSNYFARMFRKAFGISPSAYRKRVG